MGSTGTIPSGNAIYFGTVPVKMLIFRFMPGAKPTTLGTAVNIEHDDGYLNTTMLNYSYGMTENCMT